MGFFSRPEILPEDEVRLRPFAGMKPEVWVSGLFGLLAAAVVFFLLFFPAIVRPGSLVTFRSEPLGAAVTVDGVYRGQTPFDGFVLRGDRLIEMEMAGFTPETSPVHIKSGFFASLFFPRRETVALTLNEKKPNAALLEGAREFAAWSFTGEPTEFYQIPVVLSEGAYRSGGGDSAEAREILKAAARFAQTRAGVRDLARALFLTAGTGGSPAGIPAIAAARDALAWLGENPAAAAWLASMLTGTARETVLSSAWHETAAAAGADSVDTVPSPAPSSGTVNVAGVVFIPVSAGLYAAREPITYEQFAAFTAALPEWGRENTAELVAAARVTEDYLAEVDDERYPFPAVSGVSWYAAEAYCHWLTTRLPAAFSGWTAALPSEAAWEELARSPRITGAGSIWEWCKTPYAPLPGFKADPLYMEEIGSPEQAVRGGNWIRARQADAAGRSATGATERGSVPPESSTPFVTFRPVLVKNG